LPLHLVQQIFAACTLMAQNRIKCSPLFNYQSAAKIPHKNVDNLIHLQHICCLLFYYMKFSNMLSIIFISCWMQSIKLEKSLDFLKKLSLVKLKYVQNIYLFA